ncbi:hypothetical protein [Vibrio phage vB_VpaS_CHI]|nr:hypothetical protein [Vibrio phage vB_VpaS_ALK]USL90122.1 hypothetical protein [Vibrio phage vB_VpaS_CHI]
MAYQAGTATSYRDLLSKIKSFAVANGWVAVRDTGSSYPREVTLTSTGVSGQEDVAVCFKEEETPASDRYNLAIKVSTQTGNIAFDQVTGAGARYLYLWNDPIPYHLFVSADRIMVVATVSTTAHTAYMGNIKTFCSVGHWFTHAGLFAEGSDSTWNWGNSSISNFMQINSSTRTLLYGADGNIFTPNALWPLTDSFKDAGNYSKFNLVEMMIGHTSAGTHYGFFGEFENVKYINGAGVAHLDNIEVNGKNYLVVQNYSRTGVNDFFAVEKA